MSTRSQVFMEKSGVYLYKHSDGYLLPGIVQRALTRQIRWDDEEYLSRIIFSEMIRDDVYEELGYGIGKILHSDIEWLVAVNTDNQTVIVKKGYDSLNTVWSGSFGEFIRDDVSEEALR